MVVLHNGNIIAKSTAAHVPVSLAMEPQPLQG